MSKVQHAPLPWKLSPTDDTMVIDAAGNEVAAIDGDYNQPDTWPIMEATAALIVRAVNSHAALVEALKVMTEHYVDLASSGDCGFWDPEKEPQVIAARAALQLAEPKP